MNLRGILDEDNAFKKGYRNVNRLVTLLDNHDLQRRIMSHARTKHTGDGAGLDQAIGVTKLCLGALFTMRGIPQLYYGTEIGLEGWKTEQGVSGLCAVIFPGRPSEMITALYNSFLKERTIYDWTRDLISIRKKNAALRYGTTITLWSDDLVYAFLRISADDVVLAIINNGYNSMTVPIRLTLNPLVIPKSVIRYIVQGNLKHWQTGQQLIINNGMVEIIVAGKTIDIFCTHI